MERKVTAFAIPNLVAVATTESEPWLFKGEIPEAVRKDKGARTAWITDRDTRHNVYSLIEGVNARHRVTLAKAESNPPHALHGFIGDYDQPVSDAFIAEALGKMDFPYIPGYLERTLSGNARLVWLFEEPLIMPSAEFTKFFLEKVFQFFPANKLLPGFDKPAWTTVTRYHTNSGEWQVTGADPIPRTATLGWIQAIGKLFKWDEVTETAKIPLEVVKEELSKKYPRFAEWDNEFEDGAQGPSFWIDGSTSPMSAIVRPGGLQTFAAHASKGFYDWSDLLGASFVKKYNSEAVGRAIDGIYHDGRHYFRELENGEWKAFEKSDIREYLSVIRGVSHKRNKQGVSDIEVALQGIQEYGAVSGCGPSIFRPSGVVTIDGKPVLNTWKSTATRPAADPAVWGEDGQFPWLSKFFDTFFEPGEQRDFFLSWLALFYRSAVDLSPRNGQALIIAGAPGVGKTFLNHAIIASLVGGSAEAEHVLLGVDNFGGELFEVPLWTVDDAIFSTNVQAHKKFSEGVKKAAANRVFRCHNRFQKPTKVIWQGRVVITCNSDEESVRAIPDLTCSIKDKLMLFKAASLSTVKFLEPKAMKKLLNEELPWLGRWLYDFEIPEHCRGDVRYGVKAYHEASLVKAAEQSSYVTSFLQVLNEWRSTFIEDDQEYWEGTAFSLLQSICIAFDNSQAVRSLTVDAVSRHLATLKSKGHRLESSDHENAGLRKWRIYRKNI